MDESPVSPARVTLLSLSYNTIKWVGVAVISLPKSNSEEQRMQCMPGKCLA